MGGASIAQTLPSGYVVNILAGPRLVSGYVDFSTLEIEQSGNQQVGSMRFVATDMGNVLNEIQDKAFIQGIDATGQLFKGFVDSRVPRVTAMGRKIEVTAHGIEGLADHILVVTNRRPPSGSTPVESDADRLKYLLATYGSQGLYNNSFGSTDVSKIQTLDSTMVTQKFKRLTLRKAIEQVLAAASTTADYYFDSLGRLHTFDATHPEGDTAPYVVRVGNPGAGEMAPEDLEIEFDSQGLVNDYWVIAKVDAASHRVALQSSMDQYGRWADYIDAPDADTVAKAEAVGQAALTDNAAPKVRGSFTASEQYVINGTKTWKVGQMVTLYSTQHGLSGAQSRIVGLSWKYLAGDGTRQVKVTFGGDRLRLRTGGSTGSRATGDLS